MSILPALPAYRPPHLQTSALCPRFYTIDTFPRTEQASPLVAPQSSRLRPRRPHRVGRRKRPLLYVTPVTRRPLFIASAVWTRRSFRRLILDMDSLWTLFVLFFILVRFRRPVLHSLPSRFTLDFLPPSLPPHSSPSTTPCGLSPAVPYSCSSFILFSL